MPIVHLPYLCVLVLAAGDASARCAAVMVTAAACTSAV